MSFALVLIVIVVLLLFCILAGIIIFVVCFRRKDRGFVLPSCCHIVLYLHKKTSLQKWLSTLCKIIARIWWHVKFSIESTDKLPLRMMIQSTYQREDHTYTRKFQTLWNKMEFPSQQVILMAPINIHGVSAKFGKCNKLLLTHCNLSLSSYRDIIKHKITGIRLFKR